MVAHRAAGLAVLAGIVVLVCLPPGSSARARRVAQYHEQGRRDAKDDGRGTVDPSQGNTQTLNSTFQYYALETFGAAPDTKYAFAVPDASWTRIAALRRTFVSTTLGFSFPFYGHKYRDLKIAAGGFLSLVPEDTAVTVYTFYIAPLMADLFSVGEAIFFKDMGDHAIIQWDGLELPFNQTLGQKFSMQCILFLSGEVAFTYNQIPVSPAQVPIVDLGDGEHPVKAGLGDAYQRVTTVNGKRITITYHYNEVNVPFSLITSGAVAIIKPLPTCNTFETCGSCLAHSTKFDCRWCPALGACSDGIDRNRNDYAFFGCELDANVVPSPAQCPAGEPKVLHVYSFDWPYVSFHSDCTYWLEVRIDEPPMNIQATPKSATAVTVTFEAETTDARAREIDAFLKDGVPLQCNAVQASALSNIQTSVAPAGDDGLSSTVIIIIAVAGAVVVAVTALIVWLVYAFRHPESSSGRWLLDHRKLLYCSCCSKPEGYAMDNNARGPQEVNHHPAVQLQPLDADSPEGHEPQTAWMEV